MTNSSVRNVRRIRREIWGEYLKKAKGSSQKAADLMFKDAQKEYAKDPAFWGL